MDRTAVARLAATLQSAAESGMQVYIEWYSQVRNRVFSHVNDDPDLDMLMPLRPKIGPGETVIDGAQRLGVVSTYLRDLAAQGPRFAREVAATDLMEQAHRLMEDENVHVAAPIMLAGAALEEVLRDLIEVRDLSVTGTPNLTKYAQLLRTERGLTTSQTQEITALAGTRNEAAHGQFGDLSRERAALFLDRVNQLLGQLLVEG